MTPTVVIGSVREYLRTRHTVRDCCASRTATLKTFS